MWDQVCGAYGLGVLVYFASILVWVALNSFLTQPFLIFDPDVDAATWLIPDDGLDAVHRRAFKLVLTCGINAAIGLFALVSAGTK